MATIGLDRLYYAKITEAASGDETYATPVQLAKAISAELSVELAEATLYADDGAAEIVKEFKSGTLSLGVDDIGAAIASALTGATIDSNQVIISASEDGGTPVAVGFRAKKSNGKYRYFWLYRVKFGIPATNLATKGDSITFSTPTIEGTVRSILKNEKYKGCALLQKTYTPDFLTKKAVANDGTVPQYYVEDSHPAIIAPEQFALVQDIFAERSRDPKHSGATIFSGKIRCGCCGGWYGSKVWHSNDKYRRVIWQCNHKFKDKTRCKTPHLTEDEIKAAFVRLVNKLYTDREFYITELTAIKDRLGDTAALEKERRLLDEQLGVDAKAVNDLIAQNARVAQNQKEYNERYDALVSRYEETERRRDEVVEQINQIMIRRRKLERFIEAVTALPELYTEFDAGQWAGLVESMTVYDKDRIVWKLTCGMEIEG